MDAAGTESDYEYATGKKVKKLKGKTKKDLYDAATTAW